MSKHFLTVDRCNSGQRGIFCDKSGQPAVRDEPWTEGDMWDYLGDFAMILDPQSQELTEEEVKEYTRFQPLAEYLHIYGIALKGG